MNDSELYGHLKLSLNAYSLMVRIPLLEGHKNPQDVPSVRSQNLYIQMYRGEVQIGQNVLQNRFSCLYFLAQYEFITPRVL